MNWLQIANGIIVILGIPWLISIFISIGRKLNTLDTLQSTSETIKWNLKVITDSLIKGKFKDFDARELKNYSPLALTDEGKKLLQLLGFPEIFSANKTDFFKIVDSENPKLKYDAEVSAIKSILALSDKPYMNPIKVFLYNNPNRSLDNLAPTLGVYVRDEYLKEHPEIVE